MAYEVVPVVGLVVAAAVVVAAVGEGVAEDGTKRA
jgi:hypothetical protein